MQHASTSQREFTFKDSDFRTLSALVNKLTGIVLAEHKRDMVYSRLARRLRALGLQNFEEYCVLVQTPDSGEIGNLVNAITTNLTSFFREPHHFEHLRKEVLAPLAKGNRKRLRLWSSACSSGMEPYSIAMTLRQAIPDITKWDARILATDIDTNMLSKGEAGVYPLSEWEHIPTPYQDQLLQHGQELHMSEPLKQLITFRHLNLLHTWPMKGQFDAVFCRNVVIYFNKETQRELFDRMADAIVPGGWLYIGHSENLTNITDRFKLCGRTIYRRVA